MSTGEQDGAITEEGLEALKAELSELEINGRREMSKRIAAARELGDLKENAEYHIAKEDQGHMETKILRLQARLRSAVVVEPSAHDNSFTFGRTAEVLDEVTGKTQTWTIVGPTEASVPDGKLSSESPMAKALLGRAPGEKITLNTPRGERTLRIERLL